MFSLPDETPFPIALYARTSSDDQVQAGTIKNQLDALHFQAEHGLVPHPIAGVYTDDGVSGTIPIGKRPDGRRLLQDAEAGAFRQVWAYRVDRLGRTLRNIMDAYYQLSDLKVGIKSITEAYDTNTPSGMLVFQLLASLAEFDRASIMDRFLNGRDRNAREGRWMSAWVPYGFDVDKELHLIPSAHLVAGFDLTEWDVAQEIWLRIATGSGLVEEERRLNLMGIPATKRTVKGKVVEQPQGWSAARIGEMLHNPVYRGLAVLNSAKGRIETPCPVLAPPAVWEAAQAQLTLNRKYSHPPTTRPYLLRGRIICGDCGRAYVGHSVRSRYHYYRCGAYGRPAERRAAPGGCPNPRHITQEWIEDTVWSYCEWFIDHPEETLEQARGRLRERMTQSAEDEKRRPALLRQIAAKDQERERMVGLYRRGRITDEELEEQLDDIERETRELREMLGRIGTQDAMARAYEARLQSAAALLARLRAQLREGEPVTWEQKREAIEKLVARIEVRTGEDGRARVEGVFTFSDAQELGPELGAAELGAAEPGAGVAGETSTRTISCFSGNTHAEGEDSELAVLAISLVRILSPA